MLDDYEAILAQVIRARDPEAALCAAITALHAQHPVRAFLAPINKDGLRMSALLVARLRFERLLRGSRPFQRDWQREPAAAASRFSAYHEATPLLAFSPRDEANLFAAWERGADACDQAHFTNEMSSKCNSNVLFCETTNSMPLISATLNAGTTGIRNVSRSSKFKV